LSTFNLVRNSHSISWSLDAEGNFASTTTDGGSAVNRTHNTLNEVTAVGATNLTFDLNGNQLTDTNGKSYTYDAWNRLKTAGNETYSYDALGRIDKLVLGANTYHYFFDAAWQILELRLNSNTAPSDQYVWSPAYADAIIQRDRDTDGNPSNGMEERMYVFQDASWNVTAIFDVTERLKCRHSWAPQIPPATKSSGPNILSPVRRSVKQQPSWQLCPV
jgi:hypothetical protein